MRKFVGCTCYVKIIICFKIKFCPILKFLSNCKHYYVLTTYIVNCPIGILRLSHRPFHIYSWVILYLFKIKLDNTKGILNKCGYV